MAIVSIVYHSTPVREAKQDMYLIGISAVSRNKTIWCDLADNPAIPTVELHLYYRIFPSWRL